MDAAAVTVAAPVSDEAATAAVEIATIEAERDVAIAEIAAETAIETSDAEDDVEWLRSELASLRSLCDAGEADRASIRLSLETLASQVTELASGLATIAAMASLSTPQPPSEPEPEPATIQEPEPTPEPEPAASALPDESPPEPQRRRKWL